MVINPSLLKYIEINYKISKKNIYRVISNKIVFALDENNEELKKFLNLSTLINLLQKFSVSKCFFENIDFEFLILKSDRNSINVSFNNCSIGQAKYITKSDEIGSNINLRNCHFTFFEQINDKDSKNNHLSLYNCSFEYFVAEADTITLGNISEINIILIKNVRNKDLQFNNVNIKYDWIKILKYFYYQHKLFPEPSNYINNRKFKIEKLSYLRKYFIFYFSNTEEYIPGKRYNYTFDKLIEYGANLYVEKYQNVITLSNLLKRINNHVFFFKRKSNYNLPSGSYQTIKDGIVADGVLNYKYSINSITTLNNLIETYKKLSSSYNSYYDKISIYRYLHFLNSRNNFITKLTFWFNEGYYKISLPVIFFILGITINTIIISNLNLNLKYSPIIYTINFYKCFEEVMFQNFSFTFLNITRIFFLMLIETITIYSLFCLSLAIKKRFGFPKNYE